MSWLIGLAKGPLAREVLRVAASAAVVSALVAIGAPDECVAVVRKLFGS